jgi:hypothetical protein
MILNIMQECSKTCLRTTCSSLLTVDGYERLSNNNNGYSSGDNGVKHICKG